MNYQAPTNLALKQSWFEERHGGAPPSKIGAMMFNNTPHREAYYVAIKYKNMTYRRSFLDKSNEMFKDFLLIDWLKIFHEFGVLFFVTIIVAGCQTVDPATRDPKLSHATRQGAIEGAKGAALCAAGVALQRGNLAQIGLGAAACGTLLATQGAIIGSQADERDRRLLAEFEQAGLSVSVRDKNIVLNSAEKIEFDHYAAYPGPVGQAILISMAKIVNRFPQRLIEVIGHASTDEDPDIGLVRAQAVISILARYGVYPNRMFASGRGSSEPLVLANILSGRFHNRRVEIFFVPVS